MIGHIDRTEQARGNWEEFFGQDAQVADGWDTQILNPYDALYGSEIPGQVRGRIANRGQTTNTLTLTDQELIAARRERQRLEREQIRTGGGLGSFDGTNPRL